MSWFYLFFAFILCFSIGANAQIEEKQDTSFLLGLSLEELMNIPVSIATKYEKSLKEVPAVVTVITANDIANSGARNIMDVLQYVPGFEFSRSRLGLYYAGVRGVKDPNTTSRLLVLKDGTPYNGIMYGVGIAMQKTFDLKSIDRIEIIRGPGSALYGRNAFVGVINIITKSGKDRNKLQVYPSVGNFNTYCVGASYETKTDNFDAFIAIEKVKSDNTNSKLNNGMGGESVWNIGTDNLFANAKIGFKNIVFTGMFSDIINGASVGPFATESDKCTKIGIYSLEHQFDFNKKTSIKTKLYARNEYQIQHIEIFTPDITAEAAPDVPFNAIYPNGMYVTPKFKSYTYGADITLDFKPFNKHHTLIGLQAEMYGITNALLSSSYDTHTGAPLTYNDNGETIFRGKDTQLFDDRGWIEGNGHDYTNYALYFQNIYKPFQRSIVAIKAMTNKKNVTKTLHS